MDARIFDIDGTLLQSDTHDDAFFLGAVRAVLGDVVLRPSWSRYTQFTAAGILGEILADNAIAATDDVVHAVRDGFVTAVGRHIDEHGPFAEIPGARDFLWLLHDAGTPRIAYATGGWHGSARLKLATAGFPLDGVPLCTSDDHADRREIMRRALRQLGDGIERVTYYGDGQWDVQAAASLGWDFVAVGAKLGGLSRFDGAPPAARTR